VKFVQEKRLISKFFDEISQDTGKFVFGIKDTLACLEMGAVEILIVWEDLQVTCEFPLMSPPELKCFWSVKQ
jgi:peptide chain release factor subunit 1